MAQDEFRINEERKEQIFTTQERADGINFFALGNRVRDEPVITISHLS